MGLDNSFDKDAVVRRFGGPVLDLGGRLGEKVAASTRVEGAPAGLDPKVFEGLQSTRNRAARHLGLTN